MIVVILVLLLLFAFFLGLMLPALGRSGSSPQLKDSTQVRGVVQSLMVWASNNNGRYPIPSELDLEGRTVAEPGR
ncbi:MAG: hypothetical protein K2Q20_08525, partial [Phycisphaerales bacterium]|nr:hypothetical protein [Phycisphaerales bacterium]